ncbi:protein NUCLEAR FUSION DEFECTIVE 6, mitochondrial-like isoform X3 [Nymphaea colorata]|uniref:protein NUCLEAR FUSION DEFECTIVE 6, mitochondrial-like isoform X3 n=1 Tax=Nymphaea colorata TaxID=210225 RepID=UPI00129ED910|nr:protein NUCLEAR FUSION DEFECTIVE 6, mitochondrial-like isoform X3 [Nymphaea colorata]
MSRAASACAKTIIRSPALRSASRPATNLISPSANTSQKASRCRPAFRLPRPNTTTISSRYPVELSSSLLSMMPFHSVNATARLRSMLSPSSPSCWGWISEGNDDV